MHLRHLRQIWQAHLGVDALLADSGEAELFRQIFGQDPGDAEAEQHP
ncbi:hypothetical protein [Kitasatospora sp. NPDC094011]